MNYPAAEQRGICKGIETPQAAGNQPSSTSGGLNDPGPEDVDYYFYLRR